MGKPHGFPASFRSISVISCVSKLFERIILLRLLLFLISNSILFSRQTGFRFERFTLDQILYLSQSISDGFNEPKPGSWTILATIDFLKAFDFVWHPPFSTNLFRLASLLALLVGLDVCFLTCVVFQNHKSSSFVVRRVFFKDPFFALYFALFSSVIFLLLCLLPSAVLFMLTPWPFGLSPLVPAALGGYTRSFDSTGLLV